MEDNLRWKIASLIRSHVNSTNWADELPKQILQIFVQDGYRKLPSVLPVLSDEELSKIELPTNKEIDDFLGNPDNIFREHPEWILKVSVYAIVFAKKSIQAEADLIKRTLTGKD